MRSVIFFLCLGFATNLFCNVGGDNIPKIDSLINHTIENKMFTGSVLVTKNKKVIYQKTYGIANAEHSKVIDPKTSFNLSSLTRTLTTSCVLKLVDQGKLKLNDNIRKFIPDYPFEGVTIKNFLKQNEEDNAETNLHCINSNTGKFTECNDKSNNYDGAESMLDNSFEPGNNKDKRREKLINDNYLLLTKIVESASGESFKNYVHKNIFSACSMDNTFVNNVDTFSNKAQGYSYSYLSGQYTPYTNQFIGQNDGNIYSNCNDLLNFTENFFSGKLISGDLVNEATSSGNILKANRSIYGGLGLILIGFFFLFRPANKLFILASGISMISGIILAWSGFYTKGHDIRDLAMGWEKMIYNKEEVTYQTGSDGGSKNILWHEQSGLNIIILSNTSTSPNYELAKGISNIVHDQPHQLPAEPLAAIYCNNLKTSEDINQSIKKTEEQWADNDLSTSKYSDEAEKINEVGLELMSQNKLPESIGAFNLGKLLTKNDWFSMDSYSEVLSKSGSALNYVLSIDFGDSGTQAPENKRSRKLGGPIEN